MDHNVLAAAAASGLDDEAIDTLCQELKVQLAAHRATQAQANMGSPAPTEDGISNMLRDQVEAKDPSNVAALALAMWHTCKTISPAPQADPLNIPKGFSAEWLVFGVPQWLNPVKFTTPCSALNAIKGLSKGAYIVRTLTGGRVEFHGSEINKLEASVLN